MNCLRLYFLNTRQVFAIANCWLQADVKIEMAWKNVVTLKQKEGLISETLFLSPKGEHTQ